MNTKLASMALLALLPLLAACDQSDRIADLERENASLKAKSDTNVVDRITNNEKCKSYGEKEIGSSEVLPNYGTVYHEHFYSPSMDTCISVRRMNVDHTIEGVKTGQVIIVFDSLTSKSLFEYRSWCPDYFQPSDGYTPEDLKKNCPYDEFSIEQKINELKI